MGTSSLYGGPKKTSLLPSDYDPDQNPVNDASVGGTPDNSEPNADNPAEDEPQQDNPDNGNSEVQEDEQPSQPSVLWGTARSSMRKAMGNRSSGNVKGAIRNYTKALGGHTNATRQASKARKAAGVIYAYFAGNPETIRKRLEDAGIRFEGRPTKDIFNDICGLFAPVPNDLEDSLTNTALRETFADIAADDSIDLNQLESFSEELLQRLVGGLIKHYVFDKLIMQSEQTALKNCERVSDLRDLEKTIKKYIDGIVDSVVPDIVKSGLNPLDFNRAIETLFDISYQQMEELQ
jgi:hypothetical protein